MSGKQIILHDHHEKLGAKFVEFAGWNMPVRYEGIIPEHVAVREAAGIFDVSHMGEIFVSGPNAKATLQYLTCNDLDAIKDGQALYSAILNPEGGVKDDIIIYRIHAERYLVCANASNKDKDFEWLSQKNPHSDVLVEDASTDYGLLAIQGPKARDLVVASLGEELRSLERFHFSSFDYEGASLYVARTGYTGEDGFEIFTPKEVLVSLWERLLSSDTPLRPIGLGARDSLRLEACYSLHGHEIDEDITPYEAGLGWIVKLDKGDFIGRDALVKQKEQGIPRKRVCFVLEGKGVAREGDRVLDSTGADIGVVTSGTMTPTVQKAIGLALVNSEHAKASSLTIQIRKRELPCTLVKSPFYRSESL